MKYVSDKHFIYLVNPPFALREVIKSQLNGVWFDNKDVGKGWRFPRNLHAYRELYKFFPELRTNSQFVADGQLAGSEINYWKRVKSNFMDTSGYDTRLRLYQNHDVHYLTERGSCLVLNEQRTGKTPTVIKTMAALNKKRNIVVCPSSLVFNWKKEFEIWYPECRVYVVNGAKKKRTNAYDNYSQTSNFIASVLIISKDTWKIEKELHDLKFDVAIIDEAHYLRNYKSAQSKAIFELKADVKYALTGTPAVRHGVDVYGLLHFVNPDAFPSYWQFADRYWNILDNGWGKDIEDAKKHREKELKDIMAINSIQRKRKDVMNWLPVTTHQTLPVKMDKKQEKLYDQMMDTFMAFDEEQEHGVDTMNRLSQLLRLRQLCVDPRLLGFDVVGAKTTALLEFAENNDEPFIVMTTFSSYFKLIKPDLEKLGKRVGVIDGSISKKNKMETAEKFQSGKIDILLCNIIAAGTGFTLDRSDTILFVDKDFSPANNEQAQDRIVPTTKERYHPINILSLVVAGSIDETVNNILDRKEDLSAIINKPEIFT